MASVVQQSPEWADAIPEAQAKEWVSLAYLQAICAQAGLNMSDCAWDDGIDLYIGASKACNLGNIRNQRIALQLKSTTRWRVQGTAVSYQLDVKAYNDLRAQSTCDQYLVLYTLPQQRAMWIEHASDHTRLSHTAFYLSLTGRPAVAARHRTTVTIPLANQLTAASLRQLYEKEIESWRNSQ